MWEKPLQTPVPPELQLGSFRTELSQFCFSAKIFSLELPTSFLSTFFYIKSGVRVEVAPQAAGESS